MDPITQGIIWWSLFTLTTGKHGRKPFLLSAVVTNLPDFDIFFSRLLYTDQIDQMFFHRGITHTVVWGIVIGLLAGCIWWLVEKKQFSLWRLISACMLSIFGGHLVIDRLTSYGMRWRLPRSWVTTSLDTIFVLDFGMRAIVIGGFIWYLLSKHKQRVATRILLCALGYFCFAAGVKQFASTALQKQFIADFPNTPIISQLSTPEPFQPFLRRAIIKTQTSGDNTLYYEGRRSPFDTQTTPDRKTTSSELTPDEVSADLTGKIADQFAKIKSFSRGQLAIHVTTGGYIAENLIFGSLNGREQKLPWRGFQFFVGSNNIERQGDMPRFTDGRWSTFRVRVLGGDLSGGIAQV